MYTRTLFMDQNCFSFNKIVRIIFTFWSEWHYDECSTKFRTSWSSSKLINDTIVKMRLICSYPQIWYLQTRHWTKSYTYKFWKSRICGTLATRSLVHEVEKRPLWQSFSRQQLCQTQFHDRAKFYRSRWVWKVLPTDNYISTNGGYAERGLQLVLK